MSEMRYMEMRLITSLRGRFGNATAKLLPITAILILAIIAFPLGCGKKTEEVIKIGVILPLSGGLANFGETVQYGIEIAVSEYTRDHPTPKVELAFEDSQGDPSTAVSAFRKLTTVDEVKIVIGDLTSSATLAMAPIAQDQQVLLVSPTASVPALSKAGPYFYRVWTSDDFDGKVAAQYCKNELNYEKAAIAYINNDYGVGLKDVFAEVFSGIGGEVLLSESFETDESDFRSLLTKIKSVEPQVVYVPGHPKEIGLFLRQAKELGVKAQFVSNVAAEDREFLDVAGDASSGLYFTAPAFDIGSDDPKIVTFIEAFKTKYEFDPDIHAVKGHDAAMVILEAVSKGARTNDEIRQYLDTTSSFAGVAGAFHFDAKGDVVAAASIKQYQPDGSIEILEVVEPKL